MGGLCRYNSIQKLSLLLYHEQKGSRAPARSRTTMGKLTDTFLQKWEELNYYNRVCTLLSWDMYTLTPAGGHPGMADAMTFFSTKAFEMSTSDEFYELLKELKESPEYEELNEGMRFTVRTVLRDLEKDRRIPKEFYRDFVALQSRSMRSWEEAKRSSDYSLFSKDLGELIRMTKEKCAYTDPGKEPYNVLIGLYEEGMDTDTIDRVFNQLKEGLLPMLDEILAKPQPESRIYEGTYDADAQKKVQELLLSYIGFSFENGTVGVSEHPFTTSFSHKDVRVTNHYYEHDPISSMFSAIHEGGHAIFDQNVDDSLEGTAAEECPYMGLHESQSRFFENILARRKSFWVPVYDKICQLLPDLQKISLDEFVQEINHVKCTPIRTQADEVTYCLHIILRYEMEQEIFRGGAKVEDLPRLWNEKTLKYLHFTPEDDAHGILQDMHWSDASFGYFPSYLLGSIYDGMFLDAMQQDLGDIDVLLEKGELGRIRGWLSEKIHRYGALRLPGEVIREVCKKPLDAEPLLRYFREKYL